MRIMWQIVEITHETTRWVYPEIIV
jgi:hypothetical protein